MPDASEPYRRQRIVEINAQPGSREALEAEHGQVWNTVELSRDLEGVGFIAPLVIVRRTSDAQMGSLEPAQPSVLFCLQVTRRLISSKTCPGELLG